MVCWPRHKALRTLGIFNGCARQFKGAKYMYFVVRYLGLIDGYKM